MKRVLAANDGVYLENLERPVKITHILCSGGEETDKMRYARKFNQRGEANIHLIWEEWLWDSLEFGGKCPFTLTSIMTYYHARTI